MLAELKIENFALIERLQIEFTAGLNVITGETGAGKSIILAALSLILGERAAEELIREGCDFLSVEGIFYQVNSRLADIFNEYSLPGQDDETLIIRREVRRSGRNRCFVNGQTVTLGVLQAIGDLLVDLHGQHEHQSLLDAQQQRRILDAYGNLGDLLAEVSVNYAQYRRTLSELKQHREQLSRLQEQQHFYQQQLDELTALRLQPDEEEALLQESATLSHSEKLAVLLAQISDFFPEGENALNVNQALGKIMAALLEITEINPDFASLGERLKVAQETLSEVAAQVEKFAAELAYDPQRLEEVESRLAALQKASRRYSKTLPQLIAYREELTAKLTAMGEVNSLERTLVEKGKQEKDELAKLLITLSGSRQKVKMELEEKLQGVLTSLALPGARLVIELKKTKTEKGFTMSDGVTYQVSPWGLEEVEFFFSANPGVPLKPLAKVASGGEISRLMLALKTVTAAADLIPTLIFDEIDVGIGGQVAHVVGEKLVAISKAHQVLVITHLAQIAARAKTHYKVEKSIAGGKTAVRITPLTKADRVMEIARMLGGNESELALKHAAELVDRA